MPILNIAGYKFVTLTELAQLRKQLLAQCSALNLKGTILISTEGININLSGDTSNMHSFVTFIQQQPVFADMVFHQSLSQQLSFQRLKVKIKSEIITLRQPEVNAVQQRAPEISAHQLKQWLDEQRDFTLLDTRNDYEVQFGKFEQAIDLQLEDFGEFPAAIAGLDKQKPVVMYCTGGIRCEKAALYMLQHGYQNVYQLDRGILGYFATVGSAHFTGECFVFDERVAIAADAMK